MSTGSPSCSPSWSGASTCCATARAPERPRAALAALVAWSYDLLHADEKTLLQALAVHRGGASLQSLAAAGDRRGLEQSTVTYLLGGLVDKSVVSSRSRTTSPATTSSTRSATTCSSGWPRRVSWRPRDATTPSTTPRWPSRREPSSAGRTGWLASRLQLENDNFWAALEHARDAPDPALALRLAAALGWYFALAERVSEGRRFLELALRQPTRDAAPPSSGSRRSRTSATSRPRSSTSGECGRGRRTGARPRQRTRLPRQPPWFGRRLLLALVQRGRSSGLPPWPMRPGRIEAAGDAWGVAAAGLIRATGAALAGDVPR